MDVPGKIGRWRVLEEVGRGASGLVLRAEGPLGQEAAVKLLLAGLTATAAQRRRFAREAEALLRIRHPHVVALLDAGEEAGVPFLAMEWVDGETLGAQLRRTGPLSPPEAARRTLELARALERCHQEGLLHRDLKPANVLLRASDGATLLSDFGLVKDLTAAPDQAGTLSGQLLGTPGYWPPEQARGDLKALGPRSDVYGLGAVLYAALTGEPPQRGASREALFLAVELPPEPPSRLRPGIPPGLEAVCLRCLELDPARRYASAAELAAALEGHLRGSPGSPRARAALALTLGLVAALGLWAIARRHGPPEPALAAPPASAQPASEEAARLARARDLAERAQARWPTDRQGADQDATAAIGLDPRCALAWAIRARVRLSQDSFEEASREASRAIDLDPGLALPWLVRSQARRKLGDQEGAISDATRAVVLDPSQALAWVARAQGLRKQGDFRGAERDASRALELDPTLALAWRIRAEARRRLGDFANAVQDATRGLELGPKDAATWVARAESRLGLGDPTGAEEDASRAVALDPENSTAWTARALARRERDDPAAAEQDATRAIALEPADEVSWTARALVRLELRDLPGALADAVRAAELAPDKPLPLVARAAARLARGEGALAQADLLRAAELGPVSLELLLVRGRLRRATREDAAARADLLAVLERARPGSLVRRKASAELAALGPP